MYLGKHVLKPKYKPSSDSINIKNAQKMRSNHIASCALIRQKKYCQEIYDLSTANIDTNFT